MLKLDGEPQSAEVLLPWPAFAAAGDIQDAARRAQQASGVRRVLRENHGRPQAEEESGSLLDPTTRPGARPSAPAGAQSSPATVSACRCGPSTLCAAGS